MAKQPSKRTNAPPPAKARQILRDDSVRGHPLTKAQRGFFGALAGLGRKGK
jgi:hypothetical protein